MVTPFKNKFSMKLRLKLSIRVIRKLLPLNPILLSKPN